MSWGAVGVAAAAEAMSLYTEHCQRWLDQAHTDLTKCGQAKRMHELLKVDAFLRGPHPEGFGIDLDAQLALLMLAVACGSRFWFNTGEYANGWLKQFIKSYIETAFHDFRQDLTPMEIFLFDTSI